MEVTIHSTTKTIELVNDEGHSVQARVWEGHTAKGVPVIAFITRIAAERGADLAEFERDLAKQQPPTADVLAWPTRMIL